MIEPSVIATYAALFDSSMGFYQVKLATTAKRKYIKVENKPYYPAKISPHLLKQKIHWMKRTRETHLIKAMNGNRTRINCLATYF